MKIKNKEGKTLSEALKQIDYLGNFTRALDDVEYFIGMHIKLVQVSK